MTEPLAPPSSPAPLQPDAAAVPPTLDTGRAGRGAGRWSRWAGYFVGAVAILSGLSAVFGFFHPSMPDCDASNVRDAIDTIYKDKAQSGVKTLDNVQALSHEDTGAECRARVVLESGDQGVITYVLSREGRHLQVKITKAEPS
jgi:hypothetical protein